MALEIWILLAVIVAGLAACIGLRLRHGRQRAAAEVKNLYPLW
ncbi:MAG TPA: hypothetical protein VN808_12385 [Stellaceae bacterium]|nr:hypothetical protein [Stellaceae bacterium]